MNSAVACCCNMTSRKKQCTSYHLKGGGHGKITADFIGQIFSLSSVKTKNIIFIIFGIH